MLYDRLRIILLGGRAAPVNRQDGVDPEVREFFEEAGAQFSGYMSHSYSMGCCPAYFFLLDEPDEEDIAIMLLKQAEAVKRFGIEVRMQREYRGEETGPVSIDAIMADLSELLRRASFNENIDSHLVAKCYQGASALDRTVRLALKNAG